MQGAHKGDFTVRDMVGMIEGNEVKLRSVERRPGASVTFIFSGSVTGDTISDPIHMGEYLNAKFTAKRHSYPTGAAAGNLGATTINHEAGKTQPLRVFGSGRAIALTH